MRRVILLLVFALIAINLLNAGGGIWEYYLHINSTWYGNQGSNIPLNGAVLANNIILNSSTLTIEARGINTWQNNGCDVTSAHFNYRIYKQGDTPPISFNVVNLSYQSQNGNDKYWNDNSPLINLLSGITTTGTYVFEVYFDAPTNGVNCDGTLYESNNSNNFIATFVVTGTLPIDLIYFDALNISKKTTKLLWESSSEKHIQYYDVQVSHDGIHFSTLEQIKATDQYKYEFIHQDPAIGISYYRIGQINKDGQVAFSVVRVVNVLADQPKLYPNPAKSFIKLSGLNGKTETVIFLIDCNGRELKRDVVDTVDHDLSIEDLQAGIYLIKIQNKHITESFRFIKS